jgi:hypothetical protein
MTIEPIKTSTWRNASRNALQSVSAARMASGTYPDWQPQLVRGSVRQGAISVSVNHAVRLAGQRRLASQEGHSGILRLCFGMW